MANLPVPANGQSPDEARREELHDLLANMVVKGMGPGPIARRLAPHDSKQRKAIRARVRNLIQRDPNFAARVHEKVQGMLLVGLGPVTNALIQRGLRTGRPDVAKLAFEASGFHNPRVKHEHSGDIKVKVEMPRPVTEPDPIQDANVVEE